MSDTDKNENVENANIEQSVNVDQQEAYESKAEKQRKAVMEIFAERERLAKLNPQPQKPPQVAAANLKNKLIPCEQNHMYFADRGCIQCEAIPIILDKAGLPKTLLECSLSNYDKKSSSQHKAALEFCQNFVDKVDGQNLPNINLLILGSVGVGKSHLLAGLVNNIIKKGNRACYVKSDKLIEILTDSQCTDNERLKAARTRLEWFESCGFLAIDEIGRHYVSDKAAQKKIENYLMYRIDGGMGVAMASNKSLDGNDGIIAYLDKPVWSRLQPLNLFELVGSDYRLKLAKGKIG